jgi:hypothetical protein
MTHPAPRLEGESSPDESFRLVRSVVFRTLLGTTLAAILAYFLFKKTDWGLGLFIGGILSSLNLFSLRWVAGRILQSGTGKGGGSIWFWNLIRWALLALACWCLVQISAFCLLGALAGYFWFLLVLGRVGKKAGLRMASGKP